MSPLLDVFIPTISSHSAVCIFVFLMESFDEQKFFILMISNWSIVFFMVSNLCECECLRVACACPASAIFAEEKLFLYS